MSDKPKLELEEWACADDIVRFALARLQHERHEQARLLDDLIEQLRICELQLHEADAGIRALTALLEGGLYDKGGTIIAKWDALEATYRDAGLLPPHAPTEEPPHPVVAPEAPPLVIRPAAEPDEPGLTEKQQAVFDAMARLANVDWRVQVTFGRLSDETGVSRGGMSAHIDALDRKGYIRVIDRGDSKTPGTFLIAPEHRPERAAPPKTDEELIAEALAAGKVTVCPPAVH